MVGPSLRKDNLPFRIAPWTRRGLLQTFHIRRHNCQWHTARGPSGETGIIEPRKAASTFEAPLWSIPFLCSALLSTQHPSLLYCLLYHYFQFSYPSHYYLALSSTTASNNTLAALDIDDDYPCHCDLAISWGPFFRW